MLMASKTSTQTAVSSALPTIVHDLNGDDFVWVASAYALAATALQPAAGGMAQVVFPDFRRPTFYLTSRCRYSDDARLCHSPCSSLPLEARYAEQHRA